MRATGLKMRDSVRVSFLASVATSFRYVSLPLQLRARSFRCCVAVIRHASRVIRSDHVLLRCVFRKAYLTVRQTQKARSEVNRTNWKYGDVWLTKINWVLKQSISCNPFDTVLCCTIVIKGNRMTIIDNFPSSHCVQIVTNDKLSTYA